MKRLFAIFLSLVIISGLFITKTEAQKASAPSVSAESAVLIDLASREVLFEHNMNAPLGMASTTKIMTALIAAERADLSERVRIPTEAVGVEGSSIYLTEGEVLTMGELLYALLLQSANDAATAIAIAIAGSIEAFADMMNARAEEMGLSSTHFTNPHGLYDNAHYTTAYDLAIISAHALENETIAEIFSTYKTTLPIESECQKRVLVNHNSLLRLFRGAIGVNTGFTKKTGRCLVSAAERDGLTLIAVTLNAPNDWQDHMSMLDFGFASFESLTVAKAGEFCYSLPVINGECDTLTLTNAGDIKITVPKEHGALDYKIEALHRFEFAPISKGEELGRVTVSYDGRFHSESVLVSADEISTAKARSWLSKIISLFT